MAILGKNAGTVGWDVWCLLSQEFSRRGNRERGCISPPFRPL